MSTLEVICSKAQGKNWPLIKGWAFGTKEKKSAAYVVSIAAKADGLEWETQGSSCLKTMKDVSLLVESGAIKE